MSKASKAKVKERRQKEKHAKKQAKIALYESYRKQGINSKSKRFRNKNAQKKLATSIDHPYGKCGNHGCIKCYGLNFKPFLNRLGRPVNMSQWMWLKWKANKGAHFLPAVI